MNINKYLLQNFKVVFIFIHFFLFYESLAQPFQRKLLRNLSVKEKLKFKTDSTGNFKRLTQIDYINDSGLIFKSVFLNANQDTLSRTFTTFDNENRVVFDKTVYGKDSVISLKYTYLKKGIVIINGSYFGNEKNAKNKYKARGKIEKYSFHINGKLVSKSRWKKKKGIWLNTTRKKGRSKPTKATLWLDSKGLIVKTRRISYFYYKFANGYYQSSKPDIIIKKIFLHNKIDSYKITDFFSYEYYESGLLKKETYHKSPDFIKPGHSYYGQQYQCYCYEYISR